MVWVLDCDRNFERHFSCVGIVKRRSVVIVVIVEIANLELLSGSHICDIRLIELECIRLAGIDNFSIQVYRRVAVREKIAALRNCRIQIVSSLRSMEAPGNISGKA